MPRDKALVSLAPDEQKTGKALMAKLTPEEKSAFQKSLVNLHSDGMRGVPKLVAMKPDHTMAGLTVKEKATLAKFAKRLSRPEISVVNKLMTNAFMDGTLM